MSNLNLALKIKILALSLVLLGASTCARIPLDPSANASESRDPTIIFQGGGFSSHKGYLFFQKREGTLPTDSISIVVPKVNCKKESCVSFQFFRQDGSPGFSGGVKKGLSQFAFSLSEVIGSQDPVTQEQDGEYSCLIQIYALGPDGNEFTTTLVGFIRLNVLAPNYSPIGCDDPYVAFRTKTSKTCTAQFSSKGRSVVCGKCEDPAHDS